MAQPTNTPPGRSNRGFSPFTEDAALAAPPIDGGKIQGPGTGTSDSIPDQMAEGTFIMPADSTKALGIQTLNQLANMPALQGDFTPEQAHAAGIAFLSSLRDATHKRVEQAEKPPEQFNFANGGQVAFHELEPLGLDRVAGRMQTKGPGKEEYNRKYAFGPGTGRAMAPYNFMTGKENKSYSGRYANGGMVSDRPALGGYRYSELPTKDEIDSAVGAQEQATQAKPAQLRASNPMGSISESQGRQAEIKGAERQLSSLKSAREVGRQQLAHGPGQGSLSGDFDGMNGAMALSDALQKQKGMKVVGVRGDMGGASAERMQLANGGPVRQASGPRGFTPQALSGGGTVIDQDNIYPQGHPNAGQNIYASFGPQALGSSSQFAAVPEGVIGQQPPKVQAPVQVQPAPKQEVQQQAPAQPKQEPARTTAAGFVPAPDPMVEHNKKLAAAKELQSWQQAPKTTVSPEDGQVAREKYLAAQQRANDMQPSYFTQEGPTSAQNRKAAEEDASKALQATYTQQPGSQPGKPTKAEAPAAAPSAPAADPTEALKKAEAKAAEVLKQRLASDGRQGMSNAEVAQANPQGVVTMKRGANGVMEFSGNNITGPVSYADGQGKAVDGAGQSGKGFGSFAVAPAGANVVAGPNGSYAFSTTPTQVQQSGAAGFAPFVQRQGGASGADVAALIRGGATVEQLMQYNQEAQAANSSARASQITQEMQGPKHLRDWNDLRSPLGIARRNLEFDMKNGPIDRTLSGRGGAGSGGNSIAQQAAASAYGQLAANSFKGDGVTEFDRQKYADGQARQQMLDQHGMDKDGARLGMDQREADLRARSAQRTDALQEQIAQERNPIRRQHLVQQLREVQGQAQQADPYLVVPGGQQIDPTSQRAYNTPASVFNRQTGQWVQQPGQGGAAIPQAGAVQGGYRFKGGDPSKQTSWEKV